MQIGWLADKPGYIGGAELTQQEFRDAAPEGVKVIDCPPGAVVAGLDRYVAHNVTQYGRDDLNDLMQPVCPFVWFHHDLSPHVDSGLRAWMDQRRHIFCSPLQRDKYGKDGPCIPPPINLDAYKPTRQTKRHRKGTCSIAGWQNPAKGGRAVAEWAEANGPVDVYGNGPFAPVGSPALTFKGELKPEDVAQTLWGYERFVFLPEAIEPFCRCVVEAWAAGCEIVTNNLIGARHYMENDPDALRTAAQDFWEVVLDG